VITFVFCWTISFVFYWTINFVFCWKIPFCLQWDNVLCWTKFPPWTQLLNLGYWVDKPSLSRSKYFANNLSVKCRCFSTFNLITVLPLSLYRAYHCFLHLLGTNQKCTQPCYFPLPLKPAAQKLKKIWHSSMRSSRRAITTSRLPMELWSLSRLYYRECLI
jgi:hypothetical protein